MSLTGAATGLLGCGNDVTEDGGTPANDLAVTTKPDLSVKRDMALVEEPDISMDEPDIAMEGADLSTDDAPIVTEDMVGTDGPDPDMAKPGPDCLNTQQSCGAIGACMDCTGNQGGQACVALKCGCNSAADCPKGFACQANGQCDATCAGGLACNGGCCDGANCLSGNDNGKCGGDGKACAACGAGTPSCSAGACTTACAVGGMGGGACGMGFCCNAMNQCAAIANGACGVAAGACTDCSKSANGPTCLMNGTCGCAKAADCAVNQACTNGVCGTACDANTACNGGCCDVANKKCSLGDVQAGCALGMAACGTCVANAMGTACLTVAMKTFCGCKVAADCAVGFACDTVTNTCTTKCDSNNLCNGGCCSLAVAGTCQKGIEGTSKVCGNNGGLCADCAGNPIGKVCVASGNGGVCGCAAFPGDCPISSTGCVNKVCNNKCDVNNKCQFGCCGGNGACANGSATAACLIAGMAACVDCSNNNAGHYCRPVGNGSNACGCDKAADCAVGFACNITTHLCVTQCSAQQACNGGCCNAGSCVPGNAPTACGTAVACVSCANAQVGHACIGGLACGCNVSADCSDLQACNTVSHQCTNVCNANQLCKGGCCSGGTCAAGSSNSACGAAGGACTNCNSGTSATPTCTAGVCTSACGDLGHGTCGGGNCCSAGKCVGGKANSTCGYTNTCADCTSASTGHVCITTGMKSVCGCSAAADCSKAALNMAGQTCDTAAKTCTDSCGYMGATGCNGGCCLGGTCRPGNQNNACGVAGGQCNNCGTACNPGPACNAANGSCGCTASTQCAQGGMACGQRNGCNTVIVGGSCCIATTALQVRPSGGMAAACCSGAMTMGGNCTCIAVSQPSGGNASACCTQVQNNNACICIPNGMSPGGCGLSGQNTSCCSLRCSLLSGGNCVAAILNQTCLTTAGCAMGLTCKPSMNNGPLTCTP
ncbi:MAG: hypothetical protein EXR72_01475 [Myxococcales bacterium]|nr:hypothetical protein [Myxococcales bacterium]